MVKKLTPATLSVLLTMTTWSSIAHSTGKVTSVPPTNAQFGNSGLTSVEVKSIHHSGKLLVKKIKVDESTTVNGYLDAIESIFKNVVINGSLDAKDSYFDELAVNGGVKFNTVVVNGGTTINGNSNLEKAKFNNTVIINGELSAKESTFEKMITINSPEMVFEDCKVQDILVEKPNNDHEQKLTLKNTKVAGNITFESGKGIIEQDGSSSIDGKVTGATIKK